MVILTNWIRLSFGIETISLANFLSILFWKHTQVSSHEVGYKHTGSGGAKGGWGPWESCESRSRQQEAEAALAKHLAQAMQFLRLGASPRYISKLNTEGESVTQGGCLWKMTVCKYLNLGQAWAGDTEVHGKIGRVSSQHVFHQALSNRHWSFDSPGRAGNRGAYSPAYSQAVCVDQPRMS